MALPNHEIIQETYIIYEAQKQTQT